MATSFTWTLNPSSSGGGEGVSSSDTIGQNEATVVNQFGYGLLRPFRRDLKNDFANAGAPDIIRSAVGQILGTRGAGSGIQGELLWRPEFGSQLYRLRHRNLDAATFELARYHVIDALSKWEPRIRITGFTIASRPSEPGAGDNVLEVTVKYRLNRRNPVDPNQSNNNKDSIVILEL